MTATSAPEGRPHLRRPWLHGAVEAFGLLVILAAVAVRSWSTGDLLLWDEADYLSRAQGLAEGDWPTFTNGATYSDLYWIVGRVVSDPVTVLFATRAVAAVLVVLGVWIAARLIASPWLAWSATAGFAMTAAPYVAPSVSQSATAAIVVAAAVVVRRRTPAAIAGAAALIWLAAGARPEYVWVAVLSTVVALASLARAVRTHDRQVSLSAIIASIIGAVGVPAAMIAAHGSPFDRGAEGWPFLGQAVPRDWLAFAQNFSVRYAQSGEDPWLDWAQIVGRHFPGAQSIAAAAQQNPALFLTHAVHNTALAPTVAVREVLGWLGIVGIAILVAGLLLALVTPPRHGWARAGILLRAAVRPSNVGALLVVLAIGVTAMLPVVVLFPRPHYLVPVMALVVVSIVAVQGSLGSARYSRLLPFSVMCVAFGAFALSTALLAMARTSNPPVLAESARVMNGAGHDWTLLALDTGMTSYLVDARQLGDVAPLSGETIQTYLTRNGVNAVLLNDRFVRGPWMSASGADAFTHDPAALGFAPVVPGSPLWIRSN